MLRVGERRIERYDGLTGAAKGLFARNPEPIDPSVWGVDTALDPRGRLFILQLQGGYDFTHRYDRSQRYDASGAYLGTVGASDYWFRTFPHEVDFGPDGDLYVAGISQEVYRYDGETFAYKGVFARNHLLAEHRQPGRTDFLAFGPGGDLFVSDTGGNRVVRFDGRTGAFEGVFATVPYPVDLLSLPEGDLLVSSLGTDQILRFDGTTGTPEGVFAQGAAFDLKYVPGSTDAVPVPEPTTAGMLAAGLVGWAVRARWIRKAGRPAA